MANEIKSLPWVVDGLNSTESDGLQDLIYAAVADLAVASSIVNMDWTRDSIEQLEAKTIMRLSAIAWGDAGIASSLVGFAWVQDSINDVEYHAIDELRYFNFDDLGLVSSVVAFEWVQDGIEPAEADVIDWLNGFGSGDLALSIVGLEWVRDGIEPIEAGVIDSLRTFSDADVAFRILSMPFLETLEPADASAMQSLGQMQSHQADSFQRVLSHPTLSNGITDEWAPVVATLYGVSTTNPQLIDTLLDPGKVALEQRVIELPLAGKTSLAIIRTSPGSEQSLDLLEQAVRYNEEFMAASFPTGYVGWLFADAVGGGFGGTNFGTHIASVSTYDVYDGSDSNEAYGVGQHIAHEVAHYYWRSHNFWVHEGIADFMGSVSENARTGRPVEARQSPCGYARTIAELEALSITSEAGVYSPFLCNYQLGERLFLDLYRTLGEDGFREGLRDLYLLSQVQDEDQARRGTKLGVEHVRTAFKTGESVHDSLVDMVVARWYDGSEPYATPEETITPPNPNFLTIDGRLETAYLAVTREGPSITSVSAKAANDWLWLLLRWNHSVGSLTEVSLKIVGYYEDGFEFDLQTLTLTMNPYENNRQLSGWYQTGLSPTAPWLEGRYEVRIYNEGRLLAQLEYEVTE